MKREKRKKSEKSNLELPALMVTAANTISRKYRKSLFTLTLIAACLLTAASAQDANNIKSTTATTVINAAPAAVPTVRTASGIVGGVIEGDVSIFKGIPYAAAPVAANRWREL